MFEQRTIKSLKTLLAAGAMVTLGSGVIANTVIAAPAPLVIGFTSDASGQYANSGASDRRGMLMAIDEFNVKGGVLGRMIETVHMDTETTPATGSRVAERMIAREKVGFLIGAVSSGVANAISQVAQSHGVVYLNTNSSSPTESGKNCHRVKFVWDGNGANFAQAAIKNSIGAYGKDVLLVTNDYVWGHNTSDATRKLVLANGANIIDEILVPQGTRDFSSVLLKIQQLKPQVIAVAVGGDDLKAMRSQIAQLGLGDKYAWVNNQQDWPDVYGLPADNLFGVFGTTWYYGMDLPGVDAFVAKYQKAYPDNKMKVPGNVFYNGYWATRSLLEAIERVGTTNNHAVIKELEKLRIPAMARMQNHDAWMNAKTHQMQQTIYLATRNANPASDDDMFTMLSYAAPEKVADSGAEETCQLESFADTPLYTP